MKRFGNAVIFENLKEMVDPAHTALVLWDCQNALVDDIFNTGEFVGNVGRLLEAARGRGVPVVYTLITPLPQGYLSAFRTFQMMKRFGVDDPSKMPPFMQPGSSQAEVHAALAPAEEDVLLNKHSASIFFGTYFEQLMRSRGITTLLFTGIATEYGVEHSAREAGIRDFYPVVVSDGVSSQDREMHETALKVMQRICIVASTDEVLEQWA